MLGAAKSVLAPRVKEAPQKVIAEADRIGLIGGAFNPIHLGHLLVAEQVYDKLALDQVAFMPTYQSPHLSGKKTLPAKKRLNMLSLALGDYPHFTIEDLEIERKGISYTFDSMEILTSLYPKRQYYFIIGADMVNDLPNWHRIDELVELVQFVGVKRPGYDIDTPYPVIFIDCPKIEISSTGIRKAVKAGHSIRFQVPEAVRHYIEEGGLYLD